MYKILFLRRKLCVAQQPFSCPSPGSEYCDRFMDKKQEKKITDLFLQLLHDPGLMSMQIIPIMCFEGQCLSISS